MANPLTITIESSKPIKNKDINYEKKLKKIIKKLKNERQPDTDIKIRFGWKN